ncbi:MAG: nicotinate-nucleotide diphosphorylase (carboxylating) [Candidatus Omnitrophica bacterium CG07_land_8_20_14_0_80_42_15]|uniref:Probable nicotinate-nucleotide pyrophosphorylase [carboxylating] n=1 Tax=Candidatus Aquitaenariimonas noxiae TaxID=1974741 RepID=A0A2J0KV12_9BACT|nr:MAG: nicotinate-nucleotide diphosphorylase (carboxylating) [Candidatus Omnitrophica bacterium CG07_land_8_20_14_0_80_42_15]
MTYFNDLDKARVLPILRAALKEDIGKGDITTFATIHKFASVRAGIITRDEGVICGLPIVDMILNIMDYSVRVKPTINEGDIAHEDKEIIFIEGPARPILMAERTILNFLGRLSGVATKTRKFTEKVKKYNVKIMDTRKTTPLLRYLEKYAVRVGGGSNHRIGLWDQVLIKDNHIKTIRCMRSPTCDKTPTLKDIVCIAREKTQKNIKIEIEVENLKEFQEAMQARPDIIMLDNMSVEDAKKAVEFRGEMKEDKAVKLEVSGGVTLDNVESYAASGVDMISIGSLTADVKSLDMSLEVMG